MNRDIFNLIKIKPFTQLLGISPARFTQKLHKYNVRGLKQDFNERDNEKLKIGLLRLSEMIKEEANKL
jgi:hypothetical protein